MQFKLCLNSWAVPSYHMAQHVTRDKRSICCTWFAHDCALATWAYVLETVRSAVRRLSKILNCAFECNYYYYYYYYYNNKIYYLTVWENWLLPMVQHVRLSFFFCRWPAVLRLSVCMLAGSRWSSVGLPLFTTACWRLSRHVAMTDVSVAVRWSSPWGCWGPSFLLLCNCRVCSQWCQFTSGALAGYSGQFAIRR